MITWLKQDDRARGLVQERDRVVGEGREVGDGRPQVVREAAQLGLGDQAAELRCTGRVVERGGPTSRPGSASRANARSAGKAC